MKRIICTFIICALFVNNFTSVIDLKSEVEFYELDEFDEKDFS